MKFYTNAQVLGNNILLKEFNNGKRTRTRIEYSPTLYVNGNKKSTWHTLAGDPVEPIRFDSIKDAREFVKMNADVPDYPLYGNTQYQYAFISDEYPEHEIQYDLKNISIVTLDIENESEAGFGQNAAQEAKERINVITVKHFNKDEYHVFTFIDDVFYNSKNHFKAKTQNIIHHEYFSEGEMLAGFLRFWREVDPDILTGWNVRFYDVPYLFNRIAQILGEKEAKKLSPWNYVQAVNVNFMNKDRECYDLGGISILDYLQIYKKIVLDPRENYKLDFIAKVELGEGKVDWREKYDSMKDFYKKDFQWFVEYNIQDVKLPDLLEMKLKLIELVVSVAYIAKVNYVDVLAQTRTWDMLIYNWLKEEQIVIPPKEFQEKSEQFIGAYVKDPKPGLYNYVVSFDVASLYPSIIRVLNIGLETKQSFKVRLEAEDVLTTNSQWTQGITTAHVENWSLACNGIFYKKDKQSFYSRMVETLFTNRKIFQGEVRKAKKELESCTDPVRKIELENNISKFDIKQKSTKIMMNSLYGAFGSQYFRYYDLENAIAVTATGQFIIQYIQKGLNLHFNKLFGTANEDFVIYSDTDSVYVSLEKLVNKVFKGNLPSHEKIIRFMDKVCKEKLEPEIDRLFNEITTKFINGMQADKPILSMKREVIADRGIWSSKKHYILQVWNSEGDNYFECHSCHNKFSGPSEQAPPCNKCKSADTVRIAKLKIMGFDMVKSSLPQVSKDAMKKAVNIVMTGTQKQLADFIEETRLKFMKLPVEDIAFPRGVNDLEKWSDSDDEDDVDLTKYFQAQAQSGNNWDQVEGDVYVKGTPKQVKGVLLYNDMLRKKNLQSKYPPIASAEKIKFVHLKKPNPIDDKVIAFNGALPIEFGLHKYVDYPDMFKMSLISPLEKILDPIGWSTQHLTDIDQFFS